MDAQRGETGVPTTIEAQKQENVKNERRRGESWIFEVSEGSRTSFFESLAVPDEFFLAFSRPRRAFSSA